MINTNNVTIQIYSNSNPRKTMKVHYLRKETDRRKFLQMCSQVLEQRALRIFDQQGKEILDIEHIQMSGSYYISSGEEFNNYNSIQTSTVDNRAIIQLKISLLGKGTVGKSNLTTKWVNNEFFEVYSLTLLDKYTKRVSIGEQTYTCGQEAYISLRTQWMKDKDGLVFVYAINSLESFEDIKNTLLLFKQLFEKQENVPQIVIVGNKIDLGIERVISYDEGKALAAEFRGLFFETSAKTGANVNQMFTGLLQEIIQQREKTRKQQFKNGEDEQQEQKQGWCQLI